MLKCGHADPAPSSLCLISSMLQGTQFTSTWTPSPTCPSSSIPHGKRLPWPLLQPQEHPPSGDTRRQDSLSPTLGRMDVGKSSVPGTGHVSREMWNCAVASSTSGISKTAINNSYHSCNYIWNALHKVYFKNCRNQSMYSKEQINNIYCGSGITPMPSH